MKRHIQVFCSLLTFVLIFMAMPPIVFAASESPQSEDIFLSDIELQLTNQSLQAGQTGTGSHHFEISAPVRNLEICLL